MQPKSLVLLVVALGCGIVAAVGVMQIMADSGNKEGAVTAEVEPLYVALEDIEMGRPIGVEVIKLEDWPKGKAPAGALSQLEDIEGRVPKTKIFAGEPILDFKLLTKGDSGGGADVLVPKGYRVVPVKVDEVSGVAEMILPGNRVDVYLHVKKSCEFQQSMVKQILQNAKVFAVGSTWSRADEDERTIRAKTVSLVLTPAQAMKVTLAAETGKISLVLRSPEDSDASDVEQVGVIEMFGASELADTETDSNILYQDDQSAENKQAFLELLNGKTAAETPSEKWEVRLLSGDKLLDLTLESVGESAAAGSMAGTSGSGFWKMVAPPKQMTEVPVADPTPQVEPPVMDAPKGAVDDEPAVYDAKAFEQQQPQNDS